MPCMVFAHCISRYGAETTTLWFSIVKLMGFFTSFTPKLSGDFLNVAVEKLYACVCCFTCETFLASIVPAIERHGKR